MTDPIDSIVTEWGYYAIQSAPIEIPPLQEFVTRSEMGALTLFIGTVREWTGGKRTLYLEYQAYIPMALKKMKEIGEEIQEKWPDSRVAIVHRVGSLQIGEAAVVIAVSSPHRDAAFLGSRHAIERIKAMVPIWKKEIWEGGQKWIGDQREITSYPEGRPDIDE